MARSSWLLTPAMLAAGVANAQTSGALDASNDGKLEEIVVTAQRRSEDLQRVPIAITAVNGETLQRQGITQPQQLASLAPGLSIGQANGAVTQIYIRGVGTSSANAYSDNAVAFNVDGVYFARNSALTGQLFDVARVEVLKGPQGTLYGRNATGGAINVITNRASLTELEGNAAVEFGDYDLVRGSGAINLPVSDAFALRFAGQVNRRDGYFSDGYDDERSEAARVRGLYELAPRVSLQFGFDYSHDDAQGAGSVLRPFVDSSDPWIGPSTAAAQAAFASAAAPLPLAPPSDDGFIKSDSYGVSAELNWETDFGAFTVIPAYRDFDARYRNYFPGFQSDVSEEASQESLEARFASDSEKPVSYIVGAFLFHENRAQDNLVNQTVSGSDTQIDKLPTDAYAAFGQVLWRVTDELRVTGGARYTEESKSLTGRSISRAGAVTALAGDVDFDNVSWRAGVEYDVAERSMIYANVSTGFKAGGFYTDIAPNNTYRPEKIKSYVLGSKNTFLGGRLRLNGEAFYWDYTDHQESHLAFGSTGIVFKTENVGAATMQGVETEVGLKVGHAGELTLRAQYLDASFDDFSYTSVVPVGAPRTGCAVTALARPSYRITCDGMPATRAPKWSGNLGYQHTIGLGSLGSLTGAVDLEMASDSYLAIDYVPEERQSSYTLADLSFSYAPISDRYSVALWVRNVGDRAVLNAATQQLFAPAITMVDLRPPRTFGLRLSANF